MDQIRVLLVGGPAELAHGDRVREVASVSDAVKVPRGSGYEHFRYSGASQDLHGSELPVYEWCDRTKMAE